jgi:2-iminobutanoate/2-iminopropanoate deaminase
VHEKTVVTTSQAPGPFRGAPYSQGIVAGGFVFTAGQLGGKPDGSGPEGGIEQQADQAFLNLKAILEAAGSSLDRIVKTTVFLTSLDDFAGMNDVYRRHVGDVPPARSTVGVSQLPAGALIEIEAIAAIG